MCPYRSAAAHAMGCVAIAPLTCPGLTGTIRAIVSAAYARGYPKVNVQNGSTEQGIAPLGCWDEWRKLCALGRCSDPTSDYLQGFAHIRFQALIARYAHRTGVEEPQALAAGIGPRESWHLLESRFVVQSTRHGKRYKDWLFARLERSADAPLDVIQGGATLILRDAVREYLRLEFSPPRTQSLNQPLRSKTGYYLVLEELLPDKYHAADETAHREYARLAEGHAEAFFNDTDERDRIVIFARGLGIRFAAPEIAKLTSVVERVATEIQQLYPQEDNASLLMLSRLTLEAVTERTILWGKSERGLAPFFLSIEGGTDVEEETA